MSKKDKKDKKDECIQLKNINYQSMLLKRNSNIDSQKGGEDNIEKYLEQEQSEKGNKQKPWSKLEKSTKLKKLYNFITKYGKEFNFTDEELKIAKKCMRTGLERKKLQRIKDVIYDSEVGMIKNIPGLSFNEKARKCILKRIDKKGSSLRHLAPKKTSKKNSKTKRKKRKSDKSRKKKNKKLRMRRIL